VLVELLLSPLNGAAQVASPQPEGPGAR